MLWIDARTRAEFEKGHHPGAILLNEEEWTELLWKRVEVIQASERPLVVYCAGRACEASRKVTQRLRESMGLEEVYFLRGGWDALRASSEE